MLKKIGFLGCFGFLEAFLVFQICAFVFFGFLEDFLVFQIPFCFVHVSVCKDSGEKVTKYLQRASRRNLARISFEIKGM